MEEDLKEGGESSELDPRKKGVPQSNQDDWYEEAIKGPEIPLARSQLSKEIWIDED